MVVEFVRWGSQCPWADWAEEQVQGAARRAGAEFRSVDLTREAFGQPVFFPFQWFVDGRLVTSTPVPEDLAWELVRHPPGPGQAVSAETPLPAVPCSEIRPLGAATRLDSCRVCCNGGSETGGKPTWFEGAGCRTMGFVGYEDGQPVALVEAVPAADLPYGGLDRSNQTAALTCLYSNHDQFCFQSSLLAPLYPVLAGRGFTRLQVISGRWSAHPNGPEGFFHGEGFRTVSEVGTVFLPGRGWETLVLMERALDPLPVSGT